MYGRDEFLKNLAKQGQAPLARILGSNAQTVQKEDKNLKVQSIIFGLGHKARHGKDTVAAIIKNECDRHRAYDVRIYSFGAELKGEVNENALASGGMRNLFTPEMEYMQTNGNFITLPDWVQFEEQPDMSDPLCPLGKQRTLLQWWGTEFRRSVDPDYWIKKTAKRIALDKPEIAIVTDVRFPNEVAWVREFGSIIKVKRSGIPAVHPHASELALDYMADADWDAVIYNDGTLEELRQQALYVFDELMETKRIASGIFGEHSSAIVNEK